MSFNSLHEDLLPCGNKIVVPPDVRQDTLQRLHGHQGISIVTYVQINWFGGQVFLYFPDMLFLTQ